MLCVCAYITVSFTQFVVVLVLVLVLVFDHYIHISFFILQLRRGEDLWRTQLYDVTVRDLRKVNNNFNPINGMDGAAEEASGVDVNAGVDLILPRCSVSLNASAFTGQEGVYNHLYTETSDGVSDSTSVQVQDPVAKENLQLLLALCEV